MDWKQYAKAVVPAALTVLAVVVHWGISGELDRSELEISITGLLAAFAAFVVPNGPANVDHEDESTLDRERAAGRLA